MGPRLIGARRPWGEAGRAIEVVAFLASPKSVSINGDAIPVGGGALGSIYY